MQSESELEKGLNLIIIKGEILETFEFKMTNFRVFKGKLSISIISESVVFVSTRFIAYL